MHKREVHKEKGGITLLPISEMKDKRKGSWELYLTGRAGRQKRGERSGPSSWSGVEILSKRGGKVSG